MKEWAARLNDWAFGEDTGESLGLFRILAGGLCFAALAMGLPWFEDWYTEKGLWPVRLMESWHSTPPGFSLLWGVENSTLTLIVYLATMVAALMLCLGWFTRAAAIAAFIGIISLHHRSPDTLNSGDTLMRQWLFILMIAPSGAALSLDRLRRGSAEVISVWPIRLIQLQLAVLYFTTAWHKWGGDMWRDGTATYITSQLREFDRFPMPPFWGTQPWVALETYYTLLIEVALATLVFVPRLRGWVLLGGLALHAGIEYSMNIPLFAFIICSGYVGFYRGSEVAGFLRRIRLLKEPPAPRA